MSYDWVFNEVNKLKSSPPTHILFDPDYLHLRNPDSEKIIDGIFYDFFLPKIEGAFLKSPFNIFKSKDYPNFSPKLNSRLLKEIKILIDDPKRPFTPGVINKMWFVRFGLELAKHDYMFSTDLVINFSNDFDIYKIIQLMKNPYFEGLAPELCCYEEYYSL